MWRCTFSAIPFYNVQILQGNKATNNEIQPITVFNHIIPFVVINQNNSFKIHFFYNKSYYNKNRLRPLRFWGDRTVACWIQLKHLGDNNDDDYNSDDGNYDDDDDDDGDNNDDEEDQRSTICSFSSYLKSPKYVWLRVW